MQNEDGACATDMMGGHCAKHTWECQNQLNAEQCMPLKIELKTQPSQWQILSAAAIAWEHIDNKWKQTCATCDGVCSAHHTSAQH